MADRQKLTWYCIMAAALYSVRRGLIQNTPWNWWRVSGIMVDEVTCMETGLAAVLKMECMDATL